MVEGRKYSPPPLPLSTNSVFKPLCHRNLISLFTKLVDLAVRSSASDTLKPSIPSLRRHVSSSTPPHDDVRIRLPPAPQFIRPFSLFSLCLLLFNRLAGRLSRFLQLPCKYFPCPLWHRHNFSLRSCVKRHCHNSILSDGFCRFFLPRRRRVFVVL